MVLKKHILVIFLSCIAGMSYSQLLFNPAEQKPLEYQYLLKKDLLIQNFNKKQIELDYPKVSSYLLLPKNVHYMQLGYFCKSELKLERSTKFPIRFRLGEWSYVNRLEGKQ